MPVLPDIGKLELRNMIERTLKTIEVWAQLWLCEEDTIRIKDLLSSQGIVRRSSVMNRLHITVYHARRAMPSLADCSEAISITMPTAETRFMVLAPGGENPRPELEPRNRKIGIRVMKVNEGRAEIQVFRDRLLKYETREVLGIRRPSTSQANAFGARNFQPHMSMIRPGSGIDRDLTKVGRVFRAGIDVLRFDRFSIETVIRDRITKSPT